MRKLATLLLVIGAAVIVAPNVMAQVRLERSVLASGAVAAQGGNLLLAGTIGQPAIGLVTNSTGRGYLGFWYTNLRPDTILSVEDHTGNLTGSSVALQSAPNPFTEWTEIKVSLPTTGDVSLKLYDALGRRVRTLIDGPREAGEIVIRLGAQGLESGRYTAELTAAGVRRMLTLVVIK